MLDHNHPFAGIGNFRRRDEPGQPGADDDHICLVFHVVHHTENGLENRLKAGHLLHKADPVHNKGDRSKRWAVS